jgi:DNA-binding transcriptional MerR regulator
MEELYSVGELARALGVTPRTLRFYEDKGLLAPRRAGHARVYGGRDRRRLTLILRGKRLGFTLREVRDWLELFEPEPGRPAGTSRLKDRLRQRIASLEQQRADLDATLAELRQVLDQVERPHAPVARAS